MILTVTLNPTLDKFYWVDDLPLSLDRPEEAILIRSSRSLTSAGGKGINVSTFLACHGVETVALGFLAGHTGQIILQDLLARGVTANFVWMPGENRTNITVIAKGREFHPLLIHEEGPPVSEEAMAIFLRKYERMLGRAEYVVLGGSLPPGCSSDCYRTLVQRAHRAGLRVIVHAGGEALVQAVAEGPFLVKPDVREELRLGDLPVRSVEEIVRAGQQVVKQGGQACLISHHITGDILVTRDGVWELEAPVPLTALKNLVGADDALVGGLLVALSRGEGLLEAVRYGMAAALATAEVEEKLCLDAGAIDREFGHVTMREWGKR
ncbi:MAG: Tagatose-6-phosphate kinase [Candidatus Bipolaricaulis sibiricus]|uniref:Tagatose-6-phosphate kinase n=1 Tax=Bipolaricaulis sibiricus TaxID=2501609 RepID=A0A410FUC1_BIPS1|nr:MAG: Tagatose-6-phosphate kinase [Candidatus Bipolaricaulis sibiricus]